MANRIREWRKLRELLQAQLAEKANTTPAQINKLETEERRITIEWLERLAKALAVLPAELLPEEYSRPYLSDGEERIIQLYRSLDDTEQLRWQKAFAAFCEPIKPGDLAIHT